MKRVKSLVLGMAGVAVLTVGNSAVLAAGITGSKHDLTSGVVNQNRLDGTQTDELCVFCHTPHGTNTAAAVPLWNRKMPTATNFTTYDALHTATLDGDILQVGSVSLACLSCHDGTISMDSLLNLPGSGGYDPAGNSPGWTFASESTTMTLDGKLTGGIASIGTDLRNDHPVGVQYAGGGITATVNTNGPGRDGDFKDPSAMVNNGVTYWWVETESNTERTRRDILLYTRGLDADINKSAGGTITGGAQPFVECASCHDPHVTENLTFLRMSNAGSALCLACHEK
jgi:predicted CXXCH cytochrome family protein